MTTYLSAKHILIEADFPLSWISKMCAPVSKTYYHHVKDGTGPKNARGLALYTEDDRAGLIQVAREIRSGARTALREHSPVVCPVCTASHAGEC